MKPLNCALLLLLLSTHATLTTADLMVGEQVCMTGFIMDTFCIERGTMLQSKISGPPVVSLEHPELHSFHCLFDIPVCIDSGYQVLGSKDPVSGRYCQGLRIDDTDKVLVAGRAHGTTESNPDFFKCSTCNGPDGNPIAGFQATIIGTVKELGDGMGRTTGAPGTNSVEGTPILTDIQVSNEVACDPSITVTVEADAAGNECLIRSTLTDNPTDAPTDAPTPRPTATSAPTRSTKTPKTRKSSTTSKSSKGYYGSKSSKSSELSIRSKSSKSSELV